MRVRWMASFSWMRVRAGFHRGMRGGVKWRWWWRPCWLEASRPRGLAHALVVRVRDATRLLPLLSRVKMAAVGTLPSAPMPRGMEDETMDEAFAQVDERTYVGAAARTRADTAGWTGTSPWIPWRSSRTTAGCCRSARCTRG